MRTYLRAACHALVLCAILADGSSLAVAADSLDDLLGTGSQAERSVPPPAAAPTPMAPPAPSGPAAAEETTVREGAATPAKPASGVEEIIVTAQKKAQSIQDVPISITAISGEFFKEAGIANLHELAKFAPNVRFTTNACCTTVFIRGFGTPFAASAFDPTVGLALDELSIPREIYMSDPFYDLQQFEVLRGPQGTLFGKNTPAGLFNVTTARPTSELGGYVIGRAGGLGVHHLEGAIGGPLWKIGDFAQFRLAAIDAQQAGDVENTKLGIKEPNTQQRGGRAELALQPLDGLDVLLIGSGATTDSRVFHVQQYKSRQSTVDFLRRFDPRFETDPFNHQNSINLKDGLERDTHLLQANLRYALDRLIPVKDAEVVAILGLTGFDQLQALDVDFSPADILNLAKPTIFDYEQLSAEIRASGRFSAPFHFGEIELLAGVLVFHADLLSDSPAKAGEDFDEYLLSAPAFELVTGMQPPGGVGFANVNAAAAALGIDPIADVRLLQGDGARFLLDQQTQSNAVFGNAAWHLSEEWTLSLGARLTFEDKHAHLLNRCFSPGFVCGALNIEEFDLRRSRSETDFSPKATLQYFPIEELALFVTRGQGFKSGGFNNFSFTSAGLEVEPEKTVSWEVGARGTVFSKTLSYGATFFNMDVDDLQLQNLTGGFVQVRNAASARSRGLELDARWLSPWEPLSLRAAGALTDARFKEFRNAPAIAGSGTTEQDLSGRRMPFVPRAQFIATPELRLPFRGPALPWVGDLLPRELVMTTSLDVLYRSSMFLDNDLDPNTLQKPYTMLDGRIGLGSSEGTWSVGVAVSNLTNAGVLEFAVDSLTFPGSYTTFQEFQRNYAFEVRYNF